MSNNRVTPFIKRMRSNGGTFYVFNSATEDIGISINEKNNIVKLSNFALLDIPSIDAPATLQQNKFNVFAIDGDFRYFQNSSIKDGRVIVAESFQNYALNLEANLLNQTTYNAALTSTVSERVLWKWLKETGAIRWQKDVSSGYFVEEQNTDSSLGYNRLVQYVGEITAGSIRTDSFGTYNESYILVPTSHGATQVYFKQVEDDNYHGSMQIGPGAENILGRENFTQPHPDGLSLQAFYDVTDSSTVLSGSYNMQYYDKFGNPHPGWWYTAQGKEMPSATENYYLTDASTFIQDPSQYNTTLRYVGTPNITFQRSNIDSVQIEYNLDNLKNLYNDSTLTFDKIAIDDSIDNQFTFNAILVYYSVYNQSQDTILGTNLLGILFLDAAYGNTANYPAFTGEIVIPGLNKIQSSTSGFGNSFSFRLNIKSDNMMDDTSATIVDESTSTQANLENWAEVFTNLEKSLELLNRNSSTINYITVQYNNISDSQSAILNKVNDIQNSVQTIQSNIKGTPNTIAMFDSGVDPLIDSSIYMKDGFVGIKTNTPKYPLEVDGSTKVKTLYIENSIRDTSNNILLGYGSPLQLGSNTNFREVDIYTGNINSAIHIDISNNVSFDQKLADYLAESSLGNSFYWNAGHLDVSAGSGFYTLPIATGVTLGGIKVGSGLTIDNITGVLSVVSGSFATKSYVDGSLGSRDASLANLYSTKANITYVDTNKTSFIYVDGSLAARDASINFLFGNLGSGFTSFTYTDGSLAKRDVSIATLNTNKADLSYVVAQLALKSNITYVDASLAARDASINYLFNNIGSGFATYAYVDGSLNVKANQVYVDGSLASRDVSISYLSINKADLTYVVNSDAFKADKTYVDASLAARDASITYLFNNIGSGFATYSYVDGSLNVKADKTYVDGSLNVKTNKTYVDSSLSARDVSIAYLNTNKADLTFTVTQLALKSNITYVDSSLGARDVSIALKANKTYVDASLNAKADLTYVNNQLAFKGDLTYIDASLNAKPSFPYVDASLAARDASITYLFNNIGSGFTTYSYVDGSLNVKTSFSYVDSSLAARDASITYLFNNLGSGFVTFIYADGSLSARDVSIAYLNTNKADKSYVDASLNVKANKTYVDGSLGARDVSIAYLNTNKADLSYVVTSDAFKADITYVNSSLGTRDVSIAYLNNALVTAVANLQLQINTNTFIGFAGLVMP